MNKDPIRLNPVLTEALRAAAEYARYLGSSSVDTEHILLGFLRTGDAVFRGVSNAVLRERILEQVQRGTPIDPSRELPFAVGAIKALGLPADRGAEVLPIKLATAGEVLFEFLNASDTLAGRVLRSAGVTSREQINLP